MTVSQSLISRTETTAVIKWVADSTIDYIWYSINGGSTWTGINVADGAHGSYTISGLTANTTYSVKTRVRRRDTQLTTDSSVLSVTTYAYPYANSTPNFIVGDSVTIGLFNPLGRSVTVVLIGADNSMISSTVTAAQSVSGFNGASVVNKLLASIPNAKSGTYTVRVTYNGSSSNKTGGTYTAAVKPQIGSVGYLDTNGSVTAITRNNQLIVQNRSTVQFNAAGLAGGAYATVKRCVLTVNGLNYNMILSGANATVNNVVINSGTDVTAIFTVTDSRGIVNTKAMTVRMLDWQLPTAIINVQRHDNYYTPTDITVNADYAYLDGKNSVTIRYRSKKLSGNYGFWNNLQDGETVTVNFDNTFEWQIQIQITDVFGTTTYNVMLPIGMPIVYFDSEKHSTGFNCFPQGSNSVEIDGENIYNALFYKPGDTITFTTAPLSGFVTTNTAVARLLVPVGKSLKHITTISCTELTGGIRSASGALLDNNNDNYDWTTDNSITISCTKAEEHAILLKITKTSAFSNTNNNAPCSMNAVAMTLSLS